SFPQVRLRCRVLFRAALSCLTSESIRGRQQRNRASLRAGTSPATPPALPCESGIRTPRVSGTVGANKSLHIARCPFARIPGRYADAAELGSCSPRSHTEYECHLRCVRASIARRCCRERTEGKRRNREEESGSRLLPGATSQRTAARVNVVHLCRLGDRPPRGS